jgi:hypothetical protein
MAPLDPRENPMLDEAGEDELLLAAMMKLGAKGGALGAAVGGGVTHVAGLAGAGARGGARGAARGFKWTKKDVSEQSVRPGGDFAGVCNRVHGVLASAGQLVGSEQRGDGAVVFRALLGVGVGGLNPAVVTAVVGIGPDGAVTVALRAAGREGLIKQHPAGKALARITPLLSAATP